MPSLVNGLGGVAGFGEGSLSRNDDGSSVAIDIRPLFGAAGLNFFGTNFTNSNIVGSSFLGATFSQVKFFPVCTISDTRFSDVNITDVDFGITEFRNVQFGDPGNLNKKVISRCDFTKVKWGPNVKFHNLIFLGCLFPSRAILNQFGVQFPGCENVPQ